MKCFVLCGGYGTRLNNGKPGELKPAIKIINKPIIQLNIFFKKEIDENDQNYNFFVGVSISLSLEE